MLFFEKSRGMLFPVGLTAKNQNTILWAPSPGIQWITSCFRWFPIARKAMAFLILSFEWPGAPLPVLLRLQPRATKDGDKALFAAHHDGRIRNKGQRFTAGRRPVLSPG